MDLANAAGASFRADLNLALVALASNSLGSTAPATTFAGQIWIDTGASIDASGGPWIRKRNSANSAWTRVSHADVDLITEIITQAYTGWTTSGTAPSFVITPLPAWSAYTAGQRLRVKFHAAPAGSDTGNISGLGAKSFKQYDSSGAKIAAVIASGQLCDVEYDGTDLVILNPLPPATSSGSPPVRQTVLSGPVDSSGYTAFGGSTGATTVTASGTLKATAAAGGDANYTGSITNPAWTGLSTNGTMYLYLDITSGGVVTTGSTILAPAYQWGGAYSTTNLQNTFNIQEMTMKAGNGSAANQVYRVFVGEVTVAGGVVTAITWYALMGRYRGQSSSVPSNSVVSVNHNIGVVPGMMSVSMRCVTAEAGYITGEEFSLDALLSAANANAAGLAAFRLAMQCMGDTVALYTWHKTTRASTALTNGNWGTTFYAERGW